MLVFLDIVGEKVMVEHERNAQEEVGVQALAPEDAVHIGAVAVEVLRKPRDRPFLSAKLLFDELPHV